MLEKLKPPPSLLPAFVWFLIVTTLLCIPGSEFPKTTWLNKIWFDKWVHVVLFFVLVFLSNWGYSGKRNPEKKQQTIFYVVASASLFYGAAMEMIQEYFIPFRSFEWADIIADGTGCIAGLIVSIRWHKKINPCRNRGRNQN